MLGLENGWLEVYLGIFLNNRTDNSPGYFYLAVGYKGPGG